MAFSWLKLAILGPVPVLWDLAKDAVNEITADPDPEKNRLSPGCVIRENRLNYDHYGIYAGERCVVHFTSGRIEFTPIDDFAEGSGKIDVMDFEAAATEGISLQDSLARAKSKLGTTGYALLTNNCEHFAIWCRTGKAISTQAFGSYSKEYSQMMSGNLKSGVNMLSIHYPRLISDLYSKEAGMRFSRHVFAKYVSDKQSQSSLIVV